MNKPPVNLNLCTIRFPITAIVSIGHRISGIWVFLFIPCLLYVLEKSLGDINQWNGIAKCLASPYSKILLWTILVAFIYHVIAGLRHILMDIGIWEEIGSAKITSYITLILSFIVAILIGFKIW